MINKILHKKNYAFLTAYLLFFILLWMTPPILSNDSLIYLDAGINGHDLIHPHHLSYGLFLNGMKNIAFLFGLSDMPYLFIKFVIINFTLLAGWLLFKTAVSLGISKNISMACSSALMLSGLVWSYSGQVESYNFLIFCYSFTFFTLNWEVNKQNINTGTKSGIPLFSAILLAVTTTVHQAAALTVLSFSVFILLKSNKNYKIISAFLFGLIAGVLSLGFYILGWRISDPSVPFTTWMTRYAHDGRWGLASNFSVKGLTDLLLGWGKSWFNFNHEMFHLPLSSYYLTYILIVFLFFCAAVITIVIGILRKKQLAYNLSWIATWIISLEIFTLWWTPGPMNFQSHTIVPQLILIAIAMDILLNGIISFGKANERLFIKQAVLLLPFIFPLVLFYINYKYMIIDGLVNKRGYPERLIQTFAESTGPTDLNLLEFDEAKVLDLFFKKKGYVLIQKPWERPDWIESMQSNHFTLNLHKSSILLGQNNSNPSLPYEEYWQSLLSTVRSLAGQSDRLTGVVVCDGNNEIDYVKISNYQDLPLSFDELLAVVSTKLSQSNLTASRVFFQQVSPDTRNKILNNKKNGDADIAKLSSVFNMLDKSNAVWDIANDVNGLIQTSESMTLKTTGRDPYIYTLFKEPKPSNGYSKLKITAEIKPSENVAHNDDQFYFEVFFFLDTNQVFPGYIISIPWNANGTKVSKELDLNDYPFLQNKKKWIGLRLDPGSFANANVTITEFQAVK